jgi:hypothetical protein
VTAKLLVSSGKPLQLSWGDVSDPPAPRMPETYGVAIFSPSTTSVLVTSKAGTALILS